MKKVLLVANVVKEHVLKFHVPTIKRLRDQGWIVDVAAAGDETVPYCHKQFNMCYKRSPFNFDLLKGIKQLTKIIENGNYDIIYCHTPVGGVAARIAARKARQKGTRVVYFAHGYHFFKGAPKLNWLLYYPMEKILSYFTDSIVTINYQDYNITRERFKNCKAFRVNGIGIDTSRFETADREQLRREYREEMGIPEDAKVLVYLAELLPNKNQTFLMRILKNILMKEPNTYLVLAGFDHSDGAFERYAEELGIKDHVRFLGWRDDVCGLYMMSDICTAASIREGFGLNLVEAMLCKIPVIATRNRGHETIIRDGENGFLVDLGNEEMYANRILELIHNEELCAQFVRTGIEEIGKYSSEMIVREIEDILELSLVQRGRAQNDKSAARAWGAWNRGNREPNHELVSEYRP